MTSIRRILASTLSDAVRQTVARQIEMGIDIVSDGEMSKPSYSTYVKDRLTGFGGQGTLPMPADLAAHPDYAGRLFNAQAIRTLRTPKCVSPVAYKSTAAIEHDIANLHDAVETRRHEGAFLTAASPGVIALFLDNEHYRSHEAYVFALADAMRTEYEAIHAAGFLLQIDAPDLAMGRHTQFADLDLGDFLDVASMHVEAINRAASSIPRDRMRLHVCWGNYEGPHDWDLPLRNLLEVVLRARPAALSFAAANPRHAHEWSLWQDVRLPEGRVLIPGVIDSTSNFVEHPDLVAERIVRFARFVGRENVIAGTDCGLSTLAGYTAVEPSIAWSKLQALAEGARVATRTLWGTPRRPRAVEAHPEPSPRHT